MRMTRTIGTRVEVEESAKNYRKQFYGSIFSFLFRGIFRFYFFFFFTFLCFLYQREKTKQ